MTIKKIPGNNKMVLKHNNLSTNNNHKKIHMKKKINPAK